MSTLLDQNIQTTLKKAKVKISRPAGCPDIPLYLFDESVLEGPISHDEAQAVVAEPAYWSFCWASGQVLACYILEHPELVKDKTVVDFGCGSGIVGIACKLAGAKAVYVCDIDQQALDAASENAHLNHVEVMAIKTLEDANKPDLIVAADVLYDRDNYPLLDHFHLLAHTVLLADSRVKTLPSEHYQLLDCVEARTWPDLNEFEEFNRVRIYLSENDSIAENM